MTPDSPQPAPLDLSAFEGCSEGPWRWEINLTSRTMQLCGGKPRYDKTVMDFVRWGMGGAAPRFRDPRERLALLTRAEEFAAVVEGRKHHADWFQTLDHPDALLMQSAPALLAEVQRLRVRVVELEMQTHSDAVLIAELQRPDSPAPGLDEATLDSLHATASVAISKWCTDFPDWRFGELGGERSYTRHLITAWETLRTRASSGVSP